MVRSILTLVGTCMLAFAIGVPEARSQAAEAREKAAEHYGRGQAFFKVEAYEEAIAEFRKALELVPKPGFLFNIGLAYQELGQREQAIEHFRQYLERAPSGVAVDEARARMRALEKEVLQAKDAAAQAAKQKQIEDSIIARARQLAKSKRYSEAIAEYHRAFDLTKNPEHVLSAARLYDEAGERARALGEYQRYRALAPAGKDAAVVAERVATLEQELEANKRMAATAGFNVAVTCGRSTRQLREDHGLRVVVDGQQLRPDRDPKRAAYWIAAGTHVVEIASDGCEPQTATLSIKADSTIQGHLPSSFGRRLRSMGGPAGSAEHQLVFSLGGTRSLLPAKKLEPNEFVVPGTPTYGLALAARYSWRWLEGGSVVGLASGTNACRSGCTEYAIEGDEAEFEAKVIQAAVVGGLRLPLVYAALSVNSGVQYSRWSYEFHFANFLFDDTKWTFLEVPVAIGIEIRPVCWASVRATAQRNYVVGNTGDLGDTAFYDTISLAVGLGYGLGSSCTGPKPGLTVR